MARLPVVGGDAGTWGPVLEDYLGIEHNLDGTLKSVARPADVTAINADLANVTTSVARVDPGIAGATGQSLIHGPSGPTWVPEQYNVAAYGAVGNGVADDRAAIQATIDALSAKGGGTVFVPAGVFLSSASIDILAGVTLRGAGRNVTTIRSTAGINSVRLRGNDTHVEDITIDTNNLGIPGIRAEPFSSPLSRFGVRRCRLLNAGNSVFRSNSPVADFEFADNSISNSLGLSIQNTTGDGIRICGNTFRGSLGTAPSIQLIVGTDTRPYKNILISDNILEDMPATAIPIELTGCKQAIVCDNTIGAATRGVSTSRCTDLVVANNVMVEQSAYAVEVGNSQNVVISGNLVHACASLLHETQAFVDNLVIVGNTYSSSGATAAVTGGDAIKLAQGARKVRITGNVFEDWEYLRSCIRVGETGTCEDVQISDNSFYATQASTPIVAVALRKVVRADVRDNVCLISRALVAGDDYNALIFSPLEAASSYHNIDANIVQFTGDVSLAPNASGVGNGNVAPSAVTGFRATANRILGGPRGIRLANSSPDLRVEDNDTRTCTGVDVIPTTALARTIRENDRTASPTTGTWRIGDRIRNISPSVLGTSGSQYVVEGWICTVTGTPGTWVEQRVLIGT